MRRLRCLLTGRFLPELTNPLHRPLRANPPPRLQKDPPPSSKCVGSVLCKAAPSQVAASFLDDPVFPRTPLSCFCPKRHSTLQRPKLTCLQECHAERPRDGPDNADFGPDKRCTRQTSLMTSSRVVYRVHDGKPPRDRRSIWVIDPKARCFGEEERENAASTRPVPYLDVRRQESGGGGTRRTSWVPTYRSSKSHFFLPPPENANRQRR